MFVVIRGEHKVSKYADADGNYRAINPGHVGYVGYGQSPQEAKSNLSRAIRMRDGANPRAIIEAAFMVLSEQEQADLIAELPKLRRS